MQFPGTSPFGGGNGFGGAGANALTNQLTPNSLHQRRQQLIHAMVTGSDQRRRPTGAGIGGALGASLGISPFLASLFGQGNDGGGQFYGAGAPTPATPTPPATSAVDPSQAAPAPVSGGAPDPLAAIGGVLGGFNPYSPGGPGAGSLADIIAMIAAAKAGNDSGSGYTPGKSYF